MDKEKLRMAHWLLFSLALYSLAALLAQAKLLPPVQTITWKLGHETVAAFVGYWIDRSAFRDRLSSESEALRQIRRAIIIGAAMLSVSMGL